MAGGKKKSGGGGENSGRSRPSVGNTAAVCYRLAKPAAEELGLSLWDVRFLKEGAGWYLRVFIDREDGDVSIDDCVALSRRLDTLLDEADPIEGSYTFEVSSAGAERVLKRPGDFEKFLGSPVLVKLYKARDGRKEFPGYLKSYDNGDITITAGGKDLTFPKAEVALCRLRIEF